MSCCHLVSLWLAVESWGSFALHTGQAEVRACGPASQVSKWRRPNLIQADPGLSGNALQAKTMINNFLLMERPGPIHPP